MLKEPLRIIEGKAKPHEAFWRFRDAVEEGAEPELELYGYISEFSWFEDDITPKMFKDDLYKFGKGGPVTVRMNSGGGDVIAASMMRSIISEYPGNVTVKIDGLAASAATIVAIAGDVIQMQESAYFMIHDPAVGFFCAWLNIEAMAGYLDQLKTIKSGLVDAYETRTGMNRDKIAKLMTEETWMSAREAKNYGFVDQVLTSGKVAQPQAAMMNVAFANALPKQFMNIPDDLLRVQAAVVPVVDPAVEKLRAEIQILK